MEEIAMLIKTLGVPAVAVASLVFVLIKCVNVIVQQNEKMQSLIENNTAALTELSTFIKGGK